MKNFAPHIYRQRMVIEGEYTKEFNEEMLTDFLNLLSSTLNMTTIYGPFVMNLAGRLNPVHSGFEGVIIWAESGAQLYLWDKDGFFTLDVYSCKPFETEVVFDLVKGCFDTDQVDFKEV